MGYADKFNLAINNEKIEPEKAADALGFDELAAILRDFNPLNDENDHRLVNFLAGRKLPDEEVKRLVAAKEQSESD